MRKLIEIIAAPDSEELNTPTSLEEAIFNPTRLSEMSGHLLKMLLELYGK